MRWVKRDYKLLPYDDMNNLRNGCNRLARMRKSPSMCSIMRELQQNDLILTERAWEQDGQNMFLTYREKNKIMYNKHEIKNSLEWRKIIV